MENLQDHPSLQELAYQALVKDIVDVRLKPGDRLSEPALARMLGISRSPVREAIRRLQQEGLVVARPRAGAEVAGLTGDEIQEIYRIRGALEGIAASMAAERRTPEELARMYSLLEVLALGADEELIGATTEAARDLHLAVLDAAKSSRLAAMIQGLQTRIQQFRNLTLRTPGRAREVTLDHRRILDAIRDGDSVRAQALMQQHVESAYHALRSSD